MGFATFLRNKRYLTEMRGQKGPPMLQPLETPLPLLRSQVALSRRWSIFRYLHVEHAMRTVLKPLRVLSVGCGQGLAEVLLAATFPHVSFDCIDIRPRFGRAKKLAGQFDLTNISFTEGDIFRLHGGDYDLTFSVEVVEHIEDAKAAAQHLMATLRPGGYLFTLVPFASPSEQRDPVAKQREWEHHQHHVAGYDEQTLRELFPGHAVVFCHGVYWRDCATPLRNIMQALPDALLEANSEYFYTLARHDFRPRLPNTRKEALGIKVLTQGQSAAKVAAPVTSAPTTATDVSTTRQRDSPRTTLTQSKSPMMKELSLIENKANAVVKALADYLELSSYGIVWNEGERSIPQIWSIYPTRRFVHFALLSLYEFAAANFTKDRIVLDFGCGVGYGSYRLGVRGAKFVHGIELDEQSVRFGHKYFCYPNIVTECKNIHDLAADPTKHGIYDFVYCSNVMEHIPDYLEVLRSMSNLLKPGGQYFHVTPPSGQPRGNPYHVTNFTIPEWREIIEPFFPNQRYFAHIPTRNREEVISEYEFDFPECGPSDMGRLKSISGIILASK